MGPPPIDHDDFLDGRWRARLEERGLTDFEGLWRLKLPPLDVANTARGGISTVALLASDACGQAGYRLIVKRQRNHQSRTWRQPLRGVPTLQKEFLNIRRFNRCGLGSTTPIFFARRRDDRGVRAILVTKYLEGYRSFDTILEAWAHDSNPSTESRDPILRSIAGLIARMHRAGFQHNCLYPKHVFVNRQRPCPDARLIDLEKAGRRLLKNHRMVRDLAAFFRRSPFWSPVDQARFMVHYHGAAQMTPQIEDAWRRIKRAMARKKYAPAAPPTDKAE